MIDPYLRRILVTGAGGFIGRALCAQLLADGFLVRGVVRDLSRSVSLPQSMEIVQIGSMGPDTDWTDVISGVDSAIHLAARVHIMQDAAMDPLQEFRRVNLHGTECLARQAAQADVRRFVFMSTIGVNGSTTGSRAFTESNDPSPHNPYSVSKFEAEIGLKEVSAKTGMEVVIVRAPLVYGPSNPGNFLSLLRIIAKGIPLPLASVCNLKNFLYVENLADALACCAIHPNAAGQTYLVSDGEDVSTPELIQRVAAAMGKPARLFPFPPGLMRLAGRALGKSAAIERLLGSLQVDSSKIRRELGWKPPFTMADGLRETAAWYRSNSEKPKP
jgi:nucleoside-diphosphate-sugar epimerase